MEYVDWTRAVVGLILTLFGVGSGVLVWMHNRMKAVASNAVRESEGSHAHTVNRVGQLEGKVEHLAVDVGKVRKELHEMNGRVSNVERTMETVARHSDVAKLGREISGLKSAFDIQTNTITAQISMLFQKAMDTGKDS